MISDLDPIKLLVELLPLPGQGSTAFPDQNLGTPREIGGPVVAGSHASAVLSNRDTSAESAVTAPPDMSAGTGFSFGRNISAESAITAPTDRSTAYRDDTAKRP